MSQNKYDFDYEIIDYDDTLKLVTVVFDGGPAWAQIQLREPFPTTREELEDIIAQYTEKVEDFEARERPFDDALIKGLMGAKQKAPRFSWRAKEAQEEARARMAQAELGAQEPIEAPSTTAAQETLSAIQIAEEAWIASLIEKRAPDLIEKQVLRMKQEGRLK